MSEYAGYAADLLWDPVGGTVFVTVAQVVDLSGPGLARNPIDSSHRDTPNNWRSFVKGFKDPGEVTFNVVLDQDLATHGTAANGLLGDLQNDGATLPNWRLSFPDGWTWTCKGFVTGYEPSAPLDDMYAADVTIKWSGTPTFTS